MKDNILHKHKMNFVSKVFPEKKGKVLDIGCYVGELGVLLKSRLYDYYGVDIDKTALEQASSKGLKVKFCDLDKQDIPFKMKFDYVVLLDVLEHLHDPEKILKKVKKVLNKNGKLIVSLPNDFHFLNRIRFLLGKKIYPRPFSPHTHLHTFTIKQGSEFLKKNKLKIIQKFYLPGTFPEFLNFDVKRKIAGILPGLFSRSILYITEVKKWK